MSTLQRLLELDGPTLNSQISYLLGSSTKIEKTWNKLEVGTLVMYLSPHVESGWNLCPWASEGCAAACLKGSGRMRFTRARLARVRRTILFMKHRSLFKIRLRREIRAHTRKCARLGIVCSVRLNGTSDIAWEKVWPGLFSEFANVQFYDYTKSVARAKLSVEPEWPANYHLTFSRSEETADSTVLNVVGEDVNVAVVFENELPDEWIGIEVIDGDAHDYRPEDKQGVIVGLTEKRTPGTVDHTGFVVRA